jgi:hypothetical protein
MNYELHSSRLAFFNKNHEVKPNNVFGKSIEMITSHSSAIWNPDYVYHGEAISKPRHNVLTYKRVPRLYWICYDIYSKSEERYLSYEEKQKECERMMIELVPRIYQNDDPRYDSPFQTAGFILENESIPESCLGGPIEGVVFKHHHFYKKGQYVATKRKIVRPEFKERQKVGKKAFSETMDATEFLKGIGEMFNVPARFQKGVIHLKQSPP